MSTVPHLNDRILPELDELDEDERESRELPDAGQTCSFCARTMDDCECVVEEQVRCGRCLGLVFALPLSDGSTRYSCQVHGAGVRIRTVNVHYPKDWSRLDEADYADRPGTLFID